VSILGRYVTAGFLVNFVVGLAVFSLVMTIGSMLKIIDLIAQGASGGMLFRYLALNVPYVLQYTIPMSVMTAVLLLFTHLSLDGEITAMKACGLSLWQIAAPVVLAASAISVVVLWVAQYGAPRSRYAQRVLQTQLVGDDPLQLVEQGRWIREFPDLMIYVGAKRDQRLFNVTVHRLSGGALRTTVRAREGRVRLDPADPARLLVDLYGVRMEEPDRHDPANPLKTRTIYAEYHLQQIDISHLRRQATARKKTSDLTWPELAAAIRGADPGAGDSPVIRAAAAEDCMKLLVEFNGRLAISLSCLAMTLVAVPLGLRSRRRESSVGVLVSLLVIFGFYFFLMIARSMADRPRLHPDLLVWVPVVAAQVGGIWMIERSS